MARVHDLRLLGIPVSVEQQVYTTVVLMSVLVVYDGWQELATFLGLTAVIVAPVLAIVVAHFFAEVLDEHARLRRPLAAREWRAHAHDQIPMFLSALPPLLVLGIGWVTPMDALKTITVLLWTGVITLVALAGVSAARAGLRGWRWVGAAVGGGAVGMIVISLQIFLKPH